MPEVVFLTPKKSLYRAGGVLKPMDRPLIMGILNVTPDSFYDGGRYQTHDMIRVRVERMIEEGADILDIGACSTRPGAAVPDPAEEISRLEGALSVIMAEYPDLIVSVDTFRSEVASWAIDHFNVRIINDISGGTMDPEMFSLVAKKPVVYVLMHIQGTPLTMQKDPIYAEVTGDIIRDLSGKVRKLESMGVPDIWIDPGFGFGKTLEDNYTILEHLDDFRVFDKPLLVGLSRKSMIYKFLETGPEAALNGTTVLNTIALLKKADILRVHDIKQAVECLRLTEKTLS
jgi:dihydropteroate synthase